MKIIYEPEEILKMAMTVETLTNAIPGLVGYQQKELVLKKIEEILNLISIR